MKLDVEALLMCMSKKFGGLDINLSEISFLDFRKRLYKKYWKEEKNDI